MRKITIATLAVLSVLLLTASVAAAHGNATADMHADAPHDAEERADWMEQHMTEHMGADEAEQMQERMGMSYEEMSEMMGDDHMGGMMGGNGSGMGCH